MFIVQHIIVFFSYITGGIILKSDKGLKIRYFLFSFSIAFFILSLLLLFLASFSERKNGALALNIDDTEETSLYNPTVKENLSVLFMLVSDANQSPNMFLLAKMSAVNDCVYFTVLPSETVIENKGKDETLDIVYKYGGALYTKEALSNTLETPIDRYVRLNNISFISTSNMIGDIEFKMPYDVNIKNSGTNIIINAGLQLLSGEAIVQIIEGITRENRDIQLKLITDIISTVINQKADIAASQETDDIFEKTINLIDTDITFTDYFSRKDAGYYLAGLNKDIAVPVFTAGVWNAGNTQYILTDTAVAEIKQIFG